MMIEGMDVFPNRFPKWGKPHAAKAPSFSPIPPFRGDGETGNRCDCLSHSLSRIMENVQGT